MAGRHRQPDPDPVTEAVPLVRPATSPTMTRPASFDDVSDETELVPPAGEPATPGERSFLVSRSFWVGLAERSVRGAAVALLAYWQVVGDGTVTLNALSVDWRTAGGIALGGALASAALSLAAGAIIGQHGTTAFLRRAA